MRVEYNKNYYSSNHEPSLKKKLNKLFYAKLSYIVINYIIIMSLKTLYSRIYNYYFPVLPLNIKHFTQVKVIKDDYWNKIPKSDIKIDFYDKLNNDEHVGYISYRAGVGQIGLFFIDKSYQNRGLGKQILLQVIDDIKKHNATEVWAVTTPNHRFWSNVFNKSFKWYEPRQLHPSVRGDGYKMKI